MQNVVATLQQRCGNVLITSESDVVTTSETDVDTTLILDRATTLSQGGCANWEGENARNRAGNGGNQGENAGDQSDSL